MGIDLFYVTASTKYFHPDNMSSAEKMKIELTKVREEFKMSESDCGSARVQGKFYQKASGLINVGFNYQKDYMF